MRFLVLLTDAFGGRGGIAKFNRDLLTALCSYPETTEVIAIPRLAPDPLPKLPEKLKFLTNGCLNSKIKYLFTLLQTLRHGPKFNLIICGHINLLPLAYLARLFCKAPLILMIYGIDAWKPSRKRFAGYFVKRIDAYISISEFTRQKFLAWAQVNGKPYFLLPPTVDANVFTPGPKNPQLLKRYGLEGKKIVLTVARLVGRERYKGIDEVLEVLPDLAKKIPGIAYLIVGEEKERARLEKKSKSLGIADRVVFAGYIPESEKVEHYRLADCFAMPGRGEGFGIVYLEALACGIAVIGSKIDASFEALYGGRLGIVVDPKNPEELKGGVLQALKISTRAVPAELSDYSKVQFEKKVQKILGALSARAESHENGKRFSCT